MQRLSIRLKVLFGFLLFLASLLCLHLFFFVPSFRDSQLQRETLNQSIIARQFADRLSIYFKDAMAELESVARFTELQTMKKELIDKEIREVNSLTQFYNYYFVLDRNGLFVSYPTQEQLVGQIMMQQNRPWLESVLRKNSTIFVDVLVSKIGTVVSGFATPIRNQSGEVVGILRGVITLSDENSLLKSIRDVFPNGKGFAYIVSSEGKVLAHPKIQLTTENLNSSDMNAFAPVQKVTAGEKGTVRYIWENAWWYASYCPVEKSGWGVIVQQPEAEIFAFVARYSIMLMWFFVISSIIGAIIVFFIFSYTLKPLSVLVASIREGKLDSSARYPNNDIGRLAIEFNRLYHNLFKSGKELEQEREKYRILVENQTDLVIKLDLEGRFLFVSPSFCRLFGYTEADLIGQSCFRYMSEEIKPELKEKLENLPVDFSTYYRILRANTIEGLKYLEWVITAVSGETGEITALVGSGRDITLRLKTEEALAESEEKFSDLAEQSPNMIFINKMGKIVYANKLSEELLGYAKEELYDPSFNFYNLISPESIPSVEAKFKEHLQGQDMLSYEYTLITKSGKRMDAINTTKLIKYEGGNAILGIVTDISDRKNTERALRDSEEQYRLVVENANDGIIITQREKLVFANRKTEEMLGYTIRELKALAMSNYIHHEDREIVSGKQLRRIKGEEEFSPYSFRMLAKSGETLWVEFNSVPIIWNDAPALLSFIRNITIQKNLENELIQAEKMKSIGALAGGIAHDFNNKLQLLGANCYLLLMKRQPGDEDYEELMQIKDITEKSGELVKQLLSISKRLRSTLVPTNLNPIIEKLTGVLEKSFPKTITMSFAPGTELWPVNADAGQIEQVIINLAFNSKDAMPDGGKILVSTENVLVSKDFSEAHIGVQPGRHVRLFFSDTGSGMDAQTLAHIFEPTFSTKGDKKGFGLGLAMVYNILRNHNGAIYCRSVVDSGTSFEIYFPVAPEITATESAIEKKAGITGGTETLLVIDDEENILTLASKILPRYGYIVKTAQTGVEALEVYKRSWQSIDLVLIDLLMPGMDGGECLQAIMKINPHAKIIMMSGEHIDRLVEKTLQKKISAVLYKPFDFAELLVKIRSVMNDED
jgi:two-component system, cell cycle sensor histidine kinase and response regulator CckA